MNTEYRYQLESKRLTGHQPRKIACPHCGKKKCFVRYVDTKNSFDYVADTVGKCDHQHSCGYYQKWSRQMQLTTGILYNISPRLECYQPKTDLADLVLGEAHPP